MWTPKYTDLYSVPQEINYNLETASELLRCDTRFANFNSEDYVSREVRRCPIPPFFDFIKQNSKQNIALVVNDVLSQENEGVVIGYKKIKDIKSGCGEKIFEFRRESIITGIHFMRDNLIVITLENGCVELWSTRCDNNEKNDYCPFKLVAKSRHMTSVSSSTFLNKEKSKLISGDLRGNIYVWDSGAADLDYIKGYDLYYSDVTGVCRDAGNENLFFSCSYHGQSFITDMRINSKGLALLKENDNILTTIETKDNLIFIGDIIGNIKVLDQRQSSNEIKRLNIFDNSVKKINIHKNGKQFAVLNRGTELKVICLETFDSLFNINEKYLLRDVLWTGNSSFNIIGWNSFSKNYNYGLQNGKK